MNTFVDQLPPVLRCFWAITLLHLALLAAYRGLFWWRFGGTAPGTPRRELLRAFGVGLRMDLRLALLLALPILALAWMPWASPAGSAAARMAWWSYLVASWFVVSLVYVLDLAHYDYLHCRINATAVEHLQAPSIALRTAWESFPILRGAATLAVCVGLQTWLAGAVLRATWAAPTGAAPGGWSAAGWALSVLALLAGLHGRTARFPLRWSDAFFSTSPFVSALGLNPVLFLRSTWGNRHTRATADREAVRTYYAEVAQVLGVERPDADRLTFLRSARPAGPPPAPPPNVVVIILESHAGYKVGAFGNRLEPTPHFDALARQSVLFRNFFAFTSPTARAVFTLLTGIPDVNAVHSASRNPMVVRQRTIVNAFTGYDKLYFIGGSASWGNIRGVLTHNIPDVELFEEDSFESPRTDGWGISDLHLFMEADQVLRRRQRPFVSFIHTSGNHRPWTIPEDHRGFVRRQVDERVLNENGFDSLAEFNSFRFMDHALGCFFDDARKEGWYRDTIFFLLGDHGASAPHDTPWERLGLTNVHTPLLIHAPGLFPVGREIDTVASSLDVLPTAAGLAGLPYENTTLGRDVFQPRPETEQLAFVRVVPRVGLVSNEFLLSQHPRRAPELYAYRSDQPCEDVSARHPQETERMTRLCRGFLETSRFLLQHQPDGERPPARPLPSRAALGEQAG